MEEGSVQCVRCGEEDAIALCGTCIAKKHDIGEDRVAAMQQYMHDLDAFRKGAEEINALIAAKKENIRELQKRLDVYKTRKANLAFAYERAMARRMSVFWWLQLFILATLMFHAYANEAYFFVLLNGYAFLCNWRALYVCETPWAFGLGILTMMATIKFV